MQEPKRNTTRIPSSSLKVISRKNESLVRPISQVVLKIIPEEDNISAFTTTCKIILDWIQARLGNRLKLPTKAWEGESFTPHDIGPSTPPVEAISIDG